MEKKKNKILNVINYVILCVSALCFIATAVLAVYAENRDKQPSTALVANAEAFDIGSFNEYENSVLGPFAGAVCRSTISAYSTQDGFHYVGTPAIMQYNIPFPALYSSVGGNQLSSDISISTNRFVRIQNNTIIFAPDGQGLALRDTLSFAGCGYVANNIGTFIMRCYAQIWIDINAKYIVNGQVKELHETRYFEELDFDSDRYVYELPYFQFESNDKFVYCYEYSYDINFMLEHPNSIGVTLGLLPYSYKDGFSALTYKDYVEYSATAFAPPEPVDIGGMDMISTAVTSFLNMELFPNFSISTLLIFAFGGLFISFVLKFFVG